MRRAFGNSALHKLLPLVVYPDIDEKQKDHEESLADLDLINFSIIIPMGATLRGTVNYSKIVTGRFSGSRFV